MKSTNVCATVICLAIVAGCGSGGGGGGGGHRSSAGGGATSGGTSGGASGGSNGQPAPVDFARLASETNARKLAYLQSAAVGIPGVGEGIYTQISRLETGIGPLLRAPIEDTMNHMDARLDTSDFGANAILRMLYLHGQNPMIPTDLRQRADRVLLGFKYWIDEPGQDEMVYWSENHQMLFATAEYLAGHFYPQQVFPNSGLTGAQHAQKARTRILRWFHERLRFGWSEWNSPVYYEYDLLPLFNLVDFAPEPEIRERAAIAIDAIFFDLARFTNKGSFGVTAGRAYQEHKLDGWQQSVGDLVEILFGTRGRFTGRSSPSATCFSTTRNYRAPHAILGIGKDSPARLVDRTRVGISFSDAAAAGIGYQSFEDGMFWWGMGAYVAPETIVLTKRMISAYNLWQTPSFQMFQMLQSVPDALLPALSSSLSPVTEGSVLSTANQVTFRTPDAMLSSVQSFRPGQVGYQQHAWQATLGMDAVVFTTAPGTNGHDGPGEWTGSGSMPRVVQVENVLVALYNPGLAQKAVFPRLTHAFFPVAAFDEVDVRGTWTFGRKGDGYVALYSALPVFTVTQGAYANRELVAPGERNIWICQVGRRAEDGSFADFVAKISAATVVPTGAGNHDESDALTVHFDAPGVGPLDIDWRAPPLCAAFPIQIDGFPRYENPYAQEPFGAPAMTIRYAGAALFHDYAGGARAGDGL